MSTDFSQFSESTPAAGDYLVGYRTPVSGGERKFPAAALLLAANNLGDVADPAAALANLGGVAKDATYRDLLAQLYPSAQNGIQLLGHNYMHPAMTFSRASTANRFAFSGRLMESPIDEPRQEWDPVTGEWRGWLLEEQRENIVPNSAAGGAVLGVIGAGGELPTGWTIPAPGSRGLSVEVVGVSMEENLPCVDLWVSGTPDSTGDIFLQWSSLSVAASGESWAYSVFCRGIGGGPGAGANLSRFGLRLTPGSNWSPSIHDFDPWDADRLSVARRVLAVQATGVGSTSQRLHMGVYAGEPVDFAIRLAVPQLERGANASAPIITHGSPVTRAADNLSLEGDAFDEVWNPEEGTIVAELTPSASDHYLWTQTTVHRFLYATGGTYRTFDGDSFISQGQFVSGRRVRYALALSRDEMAASLDGGTPVTGAHNGSLLAATRLHAGGNKLHVHSLRYYPRRLSDAELQALTAL